ncbi:MAG: ferritin family protein [Planctomycetota bacterium]|jgi:rubrerythrin
MKRFSSVDEILDFAIAREVEANEFYTQLAEQMENPSMRKVFEAFAIEETGHKRPASISSRISRCRALKSPTMLWKVRRGRI